MKLHQPFQTSPRRCPGLLLGPGVDQAWLSLTGTEPSYENRDVASFVLDFADGSTYLDSSMRSGAGGFKGQVEIFESFLSFLLAAVDSLEYEQHSQGVPGENTGLFPRHVVEWAADNKSDIEMAQMDMCDEDGLPNETLIEE